MLLFQSTRIIVRDGMFKTVFFSLVMLAALAAGAAAQSLSIGEVAVEGNVRTEKSFIFSVVGVQAGQSVTLEEIDQDLRAIFKLGRFVDVSAELQDLGDAKLLTYRVAERHLVRKVEISGNDELELDKLQPLVAIDPPAFYSPREVSRAADAIRKAYREEGYYAATVEPRLDTSENNEATLAFVIDEGNKVLVDRIRFDGNDVFPAKELKKAMVTKERWLFSWLTDRGTFNEEALQADLEIIADQYFNTGYLEVKVKQPLVTLSDDRKYIDLLVEIDEGQQYKVGTVDIRGDLIRPKEELVDLLQLQTGDVFSRSRLRQDVFAINDLYADRGYAYVNVSPLTRLDPLKREVVLLYEVEQGLQVAIERVRISGNTKTRDKVIRRETKLVEGDLYSATRIKESRSKIRNLGFFDEVSVATSRGSDEAHMNVDVEVKERPTGTFSLGFGYSSVDGFIGQGSVSQDNFLGRALRLNLAGSFGGSSNTYQVGIYEPYFLDSKLSLGFDLYKTRRDYVDFSKKTDGGDVKVGVPVTENTRAFLVYRYENKEIYDVDADASFVIREQEGTSTLSSILASLNRNSTDYRLDPSSGAVSEGSVEFAGLGGTEKFSKYILDHRHFFPVKWGTVFSVHGRLGYIQKVGGEEIPIDERFFLGGISTLRGFKTREVGPRVRTAIQSIDPETGIVGAESKDYQYIGGDKAAYINFEYLFPVAKEMGLKGLIFFDTGNAWGEDEDFFTGMRYSAGAGIRWFSPMGPMRLEWGYNLDPEEDEERSQFEFSLGRFF
ncbi:MAG: outer membrane protein assembly factor BamA [Desulfuromonas sp.]|nr:MAG: outer membrane protein assembly factor BamA [Desulfuromonas sp.]